MVENIQTYLEDNIIINTITLDDSSYASFELKQERKDILGVHVCNWIKQNYEWFYTEFKYY